jgi:RND family efflux transporter MFP subunit
MMVRIDSRDYQAQYEAMKNQVVQATLQLKQEKARQSVARQEWDLLGTNIPEDKANRELALRIPQIESAEAALAAAKSALSRAELDLDRCTVRAPFNALVLRENIDPGQAVNTQTEIAALAGTDRYWVKVSVPVEYLSWIRIPEEGDRGSDARIIQKAGSKNITREGHVIRLLGDLDPNGRLARLLVAVDDPVNLKNNRDKLPLLLGSYVTVEITGKTMDDVVPVPRSAVRDLNGDSGLNEQKNEGIWIMDKDDRLQIEPITVVWRMPDSVLISTGLKDGMRLVTSNIATPMRGMKLSVQTDNKVTANIVSTEK